MKGRRMGTDAQGASVPARVMGRRKADEKIRKTAAPT